MTPGAFFLGVQDFFAVLLPGALAMWLVAQHAPSGVAEFMLPRTKPALESVQWLVFFLGSYVLGHFVFMAGSRLDPVYDGWRRRRKPTDRDRTFQAADALRKELTPGLSGGDFTTLKWAKAYIQIHSPGARVEIERFEATSKFFRGMVVMSVALCAHFLLMGSASVAIIAIILGLLSYDRFRDQRWKATELSYGTAVILHETGRGAAAPTTTAKIEAGNE